MKNLILSFLVVGLAIGASAYKNAPEKEIDLKSRRTLPEGYLVQTSEGTYAYRSTAVANSGSCLSISENPCKYFVPANNNIPVQQTYSASTAEGFNLAPTDTEKLWSE